MSIHEILAELHWWCDNIKKADYLITLYMLCTRVRVQSQALKNQEAEGLRLNRRIKSIAFERMAVLFGFCSSMKSVHIYISLDYTTTVNYLLAQERALRVIYHSLSDTFEELLRRASCNRRLQDKVKHGVPPDCSTQSLRNNAFVLPRFKTIRYGKHSVRYFGPLLWS